MAKQLVFSSVPHGLQPGRSGYCLIAGHLELPQSLIRKLEQETSVFPVGEAIVAPRHEVKQFGGTEWHLFINQTINIKDYSGRLSGVTHIIAESADSLPKEINPMEILNKLDNWITEVPKTPKVFNESHEILLPGIPKKEAPAIAKNSSGNRIESDPETWVYSKNRRTRPSPRPRSGFYYDRRRRKKSLMVWVIGGGVILITVLIVILY